MLRVALFADALGRPRPGELYRSTTSGEGRPLGQADARQRLHAWLEHLDTPARRFHRKYEPADRSNGSNMTVMAGHVFISYARADKDYADRLAEMLTDCGATVWYDHNLASGERWARTIREQISTCAAFIVVMTPEAERSAWVVREINEAERRGKLVLPVLLRGEVFFALSDVHFEDVTSAQLPGLRFLIRLGLLPARGTGLVPVLNGITTNHMGIEVKGPEFLALIEAGSSVPRWRSEIFSTAEDFQSSIAITVQRKDQSSSIPANLGVYEIIIDSPRPRGVPQYRVIFAIDEQGSFRMGHKEIRAD
ncbi:TIR domain-containing protein [Promicromonospora soli]